MIEAAIVRIKEDKEPVGIFVYDGKFREIKQSGGM